MKLWWKRLGFVLLTSQVLQREEHQSEEKFSATNSKLQAANSLQLFSCCSTCQPLCGWSKSCQFSMKIKKKKKGRACNILKWFLLNTDELCWNHFFFFFFLFLMRYEGSLFAFSCSSWLKTKADDPLILCRCENRFLINFLCCCTNSVCL